IKRDELATALGRGTFYIEHNARRIALFTLGLVVVAIGVFGARAWWTGREERSSSLLGQIIQTYRATVTTSLDALQQAEPGAKSFTSVEAKDEQVVKLADEVLKGYGGSGAAPKAMYYKGLALSEMKKPADAEKVFQELVSKHPADFIAPLARYE